MVGLEAKLAGRDGKWYLGVTQRVSEKSTNAAGGLAQRMRRCVALSRKRRITSIP
jgi:hypothetical protein